MRHLQYSLSLSLSLHTHTHTHTHTLQSALRQITDKAREFGADSLFNHILPLLMSPTLGQPPTHTLSYSHSVMFPSSHFSFCRVCIVSCFDILSFFNFISFSHSAIIPFFHVFILSCFYSTCFHSVIIPFHMFSFCHNRPFPVRSIITW